MKLEELKESIENNTVINLPLIFVNKSKSTFLINQYIEAISKNTKKEISYTDDINFVYNKAAQLFDITDNSLFVYKCTKISLADIDISNCSDLIIVCTEITSSSLEWEKHIVTITNLEQWMVDDYAYSYLENCDEYDIKKLLSICGDNIDRLKLEIDKVTIFNPVQQKYILKSLLEERALSDISQYTIFSLSNALQARDKNSIINILKDIDVIDVEPVGLLKIIYKNFNRIADVWLNKNPTPDNTGLKSNQIYAINKLPRIFSKEQLVNIVSKMAALDTEMRKGSFPVEYMIDYIITYVLTI